MITSCDGLIGLSLSSCTYLLPFYCHLTVYAYGWCHDIGQEQAANKPLLKTVFQVPRCNLSVLSGIPLHADGIYSPDVFVTFGQLVMYQFQGRIFKRCWHPLLVSSLFTSLLAFSSPNFVTDLIRYGIRLLSQRHTNTEDEAHFYVKHYTVNICGPAKIFHLKL